LALYLSVFVRISDDSGKFYQELLLTTTQISMPGNAAVAMVRMARKRKIEDKAFPISLTPPGQKITQTHRSKKASKTARPNHACLKGKIEDEDITRQWLRFVRLDRNNFPVFTSYRKQ